MRLGLNGMAMRAMDQKARGLGGAGRANKKREWSGGEETDAFLFFCFLSSPLHSLFLFLDSY